MGAWVGRRAQICSYGVLEGDGCVFVFVAGWVLGGREDVQEVADYAEREDCYSEGVAAELGVVAEELGDGLVVVLLD